MKKGRQCKAKKLMHFLLALCIVTGMIPLNVPAEDISPEIPKESIITADIRGETVPEPETKSEPGPEASPDAGSEQAARAAKLESDEEDSDSPPQAQERAADFTVSGDMAGSYPALADAIAAVNADGGTNYTITAGLNDTLSETLIVELNKAIKLTSGDNASYTLARSVSGRHFSINGSLILEDIVLDGGGVTGGISINPGGSLVVNNGAVIRNCYAAFGGGIDAAGGGFTLAGGKITGNTASSHGGGVYISGGSFILSGGTINNNKADHSAGGVYVDDGCAFTMSGGFITGNRTILTGTTAVAGGVYVNSSSFLMKGGEISGNKSVHSGGGVLVSNNGSFTMNRGAISENEAICTDGVNYGYGGGVSVWNGCSFTMTGGVIRGNKCSYSGGGVFAGNTNGNVVTGGADFTMTGGEITENTSHAAGGGVLIRGIDALFKMTGGEIDGNTAGSNNGGGVYVLSGIFILGDPAHSAAGTLSVSGNTAYSQGGGVFVYSYRTDGENGAFIMYDGVISGNRAYSQGGGVSVYSGSFTMKGGVIGGANPSAANTSNSVGGGVALHYIGSTLTMTGGTITGNTAQSAGGGIYLASNGALRISNTKITGNSAPNGGGIYLASNGALPMSNTRITGNGAPSDGGGLYAVDFADCANLSMVDYQSLNITDTVVFRDNTASAAFIPPADAAARFPNIQFASTSIETHPLNNYDINFRSGSERIYHVTYDANDGTGSYTGTGVPPLASDTVLPPEKTAISRKNHTFTGWNTAADGSGETYAPKDSIVLTGNVTLYAQWTEISEPQPVPEKPITPATPVQPARPDKPSEPVLPARPDSPSEPDQPTRPTKPKIPHEAENPVDEEIPATGSNNNLLFWGIAPLLALLAAQFWITRRRKIR